MSGPLDMTALARLRELLLAERELIVSGRAREAAALIQDKASALQAVENAISAPQINQVSTPQRREVEAVVQMARENAVYFVAIRNGLRSAIQRLEGMHDNAYVGSYGRGGMKMAFPQATGSYRKKA